MMKEHEYYSALRRASDVVYNTPEGRMLIDDLMEYLGLYRTPEPGNEIGMTLHAAAMRIMNRYFGVFGQGREYRSALTMSMIRTPPPRITEEAEEKEWE